MKKNLIPTLASSLALAGVIHVAPASAATYAISSMDITGGSMHQYYGGTPVTPSPLSFVFIGPNTNLVGGYTGAGGGALSAGTPDPTGIVGVSLFGNPVNTYTAASNLGDTNSAAGSLAGGPVPSGTLDDVANTITMNLSSWFVNHNDYDFYQGTVAATGTWNPLTGDYSLSWDVTMIDDTFTEVKTYWVLEGTANPVPLPAAVWLFGSGLLGLLGLVRRRKK